MRALKKENKLTPLQAKFFADKKEPEELFDLVKDPFETNNLINNPKYKRVAKKMRAYYKDWNTKNHDFGLESKESNPPSRAVDVLEWLKKDHPEVIEQMKQGIEPGYGKYSKKYRKLKKS